MSRGLPLFLASVLGCSGAPAPTGTKASALTPGEVARVGNDTVAETTVARIAASRGVTPRAAAAIAIADALFAQAARSSSAPGAARSIERAAAARSLLSELDREAEQGGPPTDAEIAAILRDRWLDLNRPESARTTHAVVLNDKPERDGAALAVAQKLADSLNGVVDGDALVERTKAFAGEGFDVKGEKLPFITPDGRSFERHESGYVALPATFDPDFARAANAIPRVGQLSPISKSHFGYHIILLEERAPAQVVPTAQLPTVVAPEARVRRAAKARHELLDRLHQAIPVQPDRAIDELTGFVKVAP